MKVMVTTQAQYNVLQLCLDGHTMIKVAEMLGRTFESVENAMSKLRIRNGKISRLELLERARRYGFAIVKAPRGRRGGARCSLADVSQSAESRSRDRREREARKRQALLAEMGRV